MVFSGSGVEVGRRCEGEPRSGFGLVPGGAARFAPAPASARAAALVAGQSAVCVGDARGGDSSLPGAVIRGREYGDALLSMFERSGIGLAILDPGLRVQAVNGAFVAQCGRGREQVCGRGFTELLHPSVRQYMVRQFGRLVQGQRARLVGRSVAMWFGDGVAAGRLTAFPVEEGGRVEMVLVLFTPERGEQERRVLVGSQWSLTALGAKVLEGVAAGDPTVRLAAKLFLSRQGVEYHVSVLLRQFKVPNRTALAAKAYSMGMFSIGCWPPRLLPEYIREERGAGERSRAQLAGARRR